MSYGLTICGACRRPRIADRGDATSTCPYCGCTERIGKLQFYYTSDDLRDVRRALAEATDAEDVSKLKKEQETKRRKVEDDDPHSTMVYRYEHASDIEDKMGILSEGLTRILGEFTLDDVREVAGPRAEKMLSAMLDRGFVYETRPGFYRARSLRDVRPLLAFHAEDLADHAR